LNNTATTDSTPLIKANLASFGEFDPGSVEMRVGSLGLVPAKFDAATQMIEYKVDKALREGSYSVIVTVKVGGQPREARWTFYYNTIGEVPEPAARVTPATKPVRKPGKK
jgi:hypothetical protein